MSKAYVINTGIITAIGNNTQQNLQSLLQQRANIKLPDFLKTSHKLPVGEIKNANEELALLSNCNGKYPRTALLSAIAVQEALGPFQNEITNFRIAFISGNTVGGMDLTEQFYRAYRTDKTKGDLENVRYHECGAITELVTRKFFPNCWSTTISTACSSSANTIMLAAKLIEKNKFDIVIAGGADALSTFTLNGFNSLMILDKEPCRPFDENRHGLNLGEGAAYLLMANETAAKKLNAEPLAYISGYANANDAHHQTASSPEGKGNQLAMMQALNQANISTDNIDYINLHGTGTQNNDSAEGAAIQEIFKEKIPPSSSTKAFIGHTLGAAGAIEAVYSILSIQEKKVWPHLRLETPMSQLNWQPAGTLLDKNINHVLSNSFGFGGNCSSLIISKV